MVILIILQVWQAGKNPLFAEQLFYELDIGEEAAGYNTDYGVGRDGGNHSEHTAKVAGKQHHDENLKRSSLDRGRVDEWLEEEIVNHLGDDEYGYEYDDKDPEVQDRANRRCSSGG